MSEDIFSISRVDFFFKIQNRVSYPTGHAVSLLSQGLLLESHPSAKVDSVGMELNRGQESKHSQRSSQGSRPLPLWRIGKVVARKMVLNNRNKRVDLKKEGNSVAI